MNKTIVIAPYSSKLLSGKRNPKNYPYFPELVRLLKEKGCYIIQIGGSSGEAKIEGVNETRFGLSFIELKGFLLDTPFSKKILISVDTWLPHFANYHKKPCYVIWGVSDPLLFGYPLHTNFLKDRKYLRETQWLFWEGVEYRDDCFISPSEIFQRISEDNNL